MKNKKCKDHDIQEQLENIKIRQKALQKIIIELDKNKNKNESKK